jgi:hypothetical protein
MTYRAEALTKAEAIKVLDLEARRARIRSAGGDSERSTASVPAAPIVPIGSGRVRFTRSSGGRGIRTHGDVAATMVFKTIAIGH